jgi:hypothetical protein
MPEPYYEQSSIGKERKILNSSSHLQSQNKSQKASPKGEQEKKER